MTLTGFDFQYFTGNERVLSALLAHPLLLALHAKWWGHAGIPNFKMWFS